MDFIVLDTELVTNPSSHSPVVLGKSFLTTTDAVIRCKNGVITLSFENMTVKLNIFHTSSQLPVMDDHEEVSMIEFRLVTHLRSPVMTIPWKNV